MKKSCTQGAIKKEAQVLIVRWFVLRVCISYFFLRSSLVHLRGDIHASHFMYSIWDGRHNVQHFLCQLGCSDITITIRDHSDLVGLWKRCSNFRSNFGHHLKIKIVEFLNNNSRCLKTIEKVSFYKVASESSYDYILSGQKFIKNDQFGRVFEDLKLAVRQCYQTGQF